MLKLRSTLLTILLVCYFAPGFAQHKDHLYKYITHDVSKPDYHQAQFLIKPYSYEDRFPSDSLNVEFGSVQQIQDFIDKGLHKKVVGIRLKVDSANIDRAIGLLKAYPRLCFLGFDESPIFAFKVKKILLPGSIKELKNLQGVEFIFTGIDIPDALVKLRPLKKLSAISLALVKGPLPKEVLQLKNITTIKLNATHIRDLDISDTKWEHVFFDGVDPKLGINVPALKKLAALPSLKNLQLNSCVLDNNAAVLQEFKGIRSLKVQFVTLSKGQQLFDHIGKLRQLEALSIRPYYDSTQTTEGLEQLTNLRLLSIENMPRITRMPDVFDALSKLKVLYLSDCNFTHVPLNIFRLRDLEHIELFGDKLTTLPEGDYRCKKLRSAKIIYSALTNIPEAFTSLTKLEDINFGSNQISSIPTHGWERLTKLKHLNLSSNKISVYPGGVEQLTGLQTLGLFDNRISSMPDLPGSGYQLTSLLLSSNNLNVLPEHIGKYDQLTFLGISQNKLTTLPASLGNCTKLRRFEAAVFPRPKRADGTADSTYYINALPEGLKNTPDMEVLNVSGNRGIDPASVFNVILAMPRFNFVANCSDIGLTEIPPSDQWRNVVLGRFDLDNNQLTTLPPQFAAMKTVRNMDLRKNPFPGNAANLAKSEIDSKGQLIALYNELRVALPQNIVSAADYATGLALSISEMVEAKMFAKAVEYAEKSIKLDSAAYNRTVRWDDIAVARYHTKDYTGAITDLERYLLKDKKNFIIIGGMPERALKYKAGAHIILGQKEQAAQTFEYFARQYHVAGALQNAALTYKEIGRDDKFDQLMDTVIKHQKFSQEFNIKQKRTDVGSILDHAESLIVAGKPNEAIKVINGLDTKLYTGNYLPINNYLLATANYLLAPEQFEQIKTKLTADIKTNGKMSGWNFDMFNKWVELNFADADKKAKLMQLQALGK
ncbi:leucine-rich repeat protein [Mucilaginibacter myungsuensis]|uniref:Leucine-rich repeat protein n=1 Tax=Mucilaginibacter myungsuensis TaxID=649104 RepID=A0A929KXG1_9SPHI|nr:leucine-rich repeat protein [Mucilaginibacter myungsuensis]MBE9663429.1 leucine-rich repeat protein [Mucilaginibacter myungsuensis]MDN3600167.1 leucine-rich repeat protein [Mucilaginibacter myungsuensis]